MNTQKVYIPTLLTLALLAVAFAVTLPAFAHGTESHTHKSTTASSTIKMKKDKNATSTRSVDLTCMQTAVDARESALTTAFGTFHDAVDTALTARKTALHDAWGLTDKTARLAAIKSARETFKKSHESALKTLKKSRVTAWESFKTTAKKTCKETLPKGDDAVEKETAGSIAI
jgi:hypothetical protein